MRPIYVLRSGRKIAEKMKQKMKQNAKMISKFNTIALSFF